MNRENETVEKDQAVDPLHYKPEGVPEAWDYMLALYGTDRHVDYLVQTTLKYLIRLDKKDSKEVNLRKAKAFLDRAVSLTVEKINE